MLEIEKVVTFTLNTHYLEDYKAKFEAKYKALRHEKTEYASIIRVLTQSDAEEHEADTSVEDDNDHVQWTPSRSSRGGLGFRPARPVTPKPTEVMKRDSILGALRGFGLPATVDHVLKMLPDDPAVSIMADVRAYWQGMSP